MRKKRVVVYCRVDRGGSPEEQHNILAMQKEKLEQHAGIRDMEIVGYYQDAGYSGHDLSRPGLNQMITDYKAGKFDAVLIVKHTRLFRGSVWSKPQWPFPIISANQLDELRSRRKER